MQTEAIHHRRYLPTVPGGFRLVLSLLNCYDRAPVGIEGSGMKWLGAPNLRMILAVQSGFVKMQLLSQPYLCGPSEFITLRQHRVSRMKRGIGFLRV